MTRAALIEQAVRDVHASPAWCQCPWIELQAEVAHDGEFINALHIRFFYAVCSRFAQLVGGTKNYNADGRVIDGAPL